MISADLSMDEEREEKMKKKLGEILMDDGVLHPSQLDKALWTQSSRLPNMRLGRILIELEMITSQQMYSALCRQNNLPETIL